MVLLHLFLQGAFRFMSMFTYECWWIPPFTKWVLFWALTPKLRVAWRCLSVLTHSYNVTDPRMSKES